MALNVITMDNLRSHICDVLHKAFKICYMWLVMIQMQKITNCPLYLYQVLTECNSQGWHTSLIYAAYQLQCQNHLCSYSMMIQWQPCWLKTGLHNMAPLSKQTKTNHMETKMGYRDRSQYFQPQTSYTPHTSDHILHYYHIILHNMHHKWWCEVVHWTVKRSLLTAEEHHFITSF
jgi:hypothetical protein